MPSMASAVTSSSDEVYGDPFLGGTLLPAGPLPLSTASVPSVGPKGFGAVGLWDGFKVGNRLGLIAPGMEGAPDRPVFPSPKDFCARWDTAPPRIGPKTVRVSTRPNGPPPIGVLVRGGRPCN